MRTIKIDIYRRTELMFFQELLKLSVIMGPETDMLYIKYIQHIHESGSNTSTPETLCCVLEINWKKH